MDLIYLAPICAVIGLLFALYSYSVVKKEGTGDEKMQKISAAIHLGAMVFLNRQYRAIGAFVVVIAIILAGLSFVTDDSMSIWAAPAYVIGAALSSLAGYIGMHSATKANVRTTNAATRG
ncbi:MAG TPA: sodium/proton-translocating pyrophosphatase, partial [Methanocorpusculum sp.]|nr:sodium/proton-translocating pyrophosphatase [Methanocorpusculum sp.]